MKVVQFEKKLTEREQEIQASIVAGLKSYLKRAKAGEFKGLALAAINAEGQAHNFNSHTDNMTALVGAIGIAQYRLCTDLVIVTETKVDEPEDE